MTASSAAARAARTALEQRSRATGEDMQRLLERYVTERFLYRLGASSYRSQLVLKGAVLFTAWLAVPHRATRDVDFTHVRDIDESEARLIIGDICSIDTQDDGVEFDLETMEVAAIREQAAYPGLRTTVRTTVGRARIKLQVDIGFGDVITPLPSDVAIPPLTAQPAPSVLACPRETVIAEKLECVVQLGMVNSRMKDYFDLRELARSFEYDLDAVAAAIRATFERRGTTVPNGDVPGLSSAFASAADKQAQWAGFLRRIDRDDEPLETCVGEVAAFAMPIFAAADQRASGPQRWTSGTGWAPT